MRFILLALALSTAPLAIAQSNSPASPIPNPTPCKSTLPFIAPSANACFEALSPSVTQNSALRPPRQTAPFVFPNAQEATPAQPGTRDPNPFLAFNQIAPQGIPTPRAGAMAEPIPTVFPNAHAEKIPTTWPGLKLLLIDQPQSANATTDTKKK